ncbi:MAG: hypothetical protein ACOX6I_08430 [Syntrophomonadaceae bacterium]
MDTIKSFLLIILFLFAVVIGWVLIVNITLNYSLLNVNYYTKQVEKHKLYELPKNNIILNLKKQTSGEIPEPINNALNNALDKSFTPTWTEDQVSRIVTNILGYLKGHNDKPNLTVNLTDRKQLLAKNLELELSKILPEKISLYNIDTNAAQVSRQIMNNLKLPDQLDCSSLLLQDNARVQSIISIIQKYYYWLVTLPCVLLILSFLIIYRFSNRHASLKWCGNSMIVAGILSVIGVFIFNGPLEHIMVNNISYQAELLAIAIDPAILATVFKNDLVVINSAVGVLYGIIGIVVTFLGHHLEKQIISSKATEF